METPADSPKFPAKTCRLELQTEKHGNGSNMSVNIQDSRSYLATENKRLTWWQRRTRLEKRMVLIGCIIILVGAGFMVALILVSTKGLSKNIINEGDHGNIKVSDLCTNSDCLLAARYVKESMDISADPCEDFVTFACGKWNDKHPVPEDKSGYSVFTEKRDELAIDLRKEIEKPKDPDEPKAIQDGKEIYEICMNTAVADIYGRERFLHWISEYGGWPMTMKSWNKSAFDWEDVIVKLTRDSSFYFISFSILPDAKNTSTNAVYLSFVGPFLSKDYFMNPKNYSHILKAYRKVMVELTGVMANGSKISEEEIDELIAFETALANISASTKKSDSREELYNKITISELANATEHQFDWLQYFNGVFEDVTNVTENASVIIYDPSPFQKFFKLIDSVDNRTIANYLMWSYFLKYSWHINNVTRESIFNFSKIITGIKVQEPRWQFCVKMLNDYYPHVMGNIFVKKYVENGTKEQAVDMIKDLRISLGNVLRENTWMDDETLKKAQEKADSLVEFVAYPEWIRNDTVINEYYENIKPSPMHIENIRNVLMHLTNVTIYTIVEPFDRNSWSISPSTVNAFYNPSANSIEFPAGILQPPFFGANNIKAMNYGAVGAVIGHELTHAFDNNGRQNDKAGNLKQWWTNSSLDAYHSKANCIRNQYSNYCSSTVQAKLNISEKACVNGNETLDENIADNGGIKIAINAYKSWIARNGNDPRLPGLTQFTPQQLFFVSFAQVWCGTYTWLGLYNEMKYGDHSPGGYRIVGTLSNSEDFAEAFQCKKYAAMNPVLKCSFW